MEKCSNVAGWAATERRRPRKTANLAECDCPLSTSSPSTLHAAPLLTCCLKMATKKAVCPAICTRQASSVHEGPARIAHGAHACCWQHLPTTDAHTCCPHPYTTARAHADPHPVRIAWPPLLLRQCHPIPSPAQVQPSLPYLNAALADERGPEELPKGHQEVAAADAAQIKGGVGVGGQQQDAPKAVRLHGRRAWRLWACVQSLDTRQGGM